MKFGGLPINEETAMQAIKACQQGNFAQKFPISARLDEDYNRTFGHFYDHGASFELEEYQDSPMKEVAAVRIAAICVFHVVLEARRFMLLDKSERQVTPIEGDLADFIRLSQHQGKRLMEQYFDTQDVFTQQHKWGTLSLDLRGGVISGAVTAMSQLMGIKTPISVVSYDESAKSPALFKNEDSKLILVYNKELLGQDYSSMLGIIGRELRQQHRREDMPVNQISPGVSVLNAISNLGVQVFQSPNPVYLQTRDDPDADRKQILDRRKSFQPCELDASIFASGIAAKSKELMDEVMATKSSAAIS